MTFTRVREIMTYSNPWIRVYFDDVSDGERLGSYTRIVEGEGRPGVVVLPTTHERVGLVRLYRYPIDEVVWELPRGFGEGPASPEDAVRELYEETGWTAKELISLGSLHSNSGLLASTTHLYLARVDEQQPAATDGETLEARWFETAEVQAMAADGRIRDAFTLAALYRAEHQALLAPGAALTRP